MVTRQADDRVPRRLRRRRPRRATIAVVLACALGLALLWPAVGVLQARLAVAGSPAARHVVAGCEGVLGWSFVYHVALLPRGGAVCSALAHQRAFYSYMMGRVSPEHWLRYDCEVSTPRDLPFCRERVLPGPAAWGLLLGPPDPDIQRLATGGGF